jgi:putative transcriptional regulator
MSSEAIAGLTPGRLLVATPILVDPNFDHTVVLLLDHDESGSLGVVLNRPSPVPVHSILPDWSERVPEPDVIFQGGPVATDSALAVARLAGTSEEDEPVGFRRLFGDVGIIDLDTPPELLAPVLTGIRVFAGYAGWGSGQLANEITEGSWLVLDSDRSDVFGRAPDRLWNDVLRRQPGEVAWLSTMPVDPTMN